MTNPLTVICIIDGLIYRSESNKNLSSITHRQNYVKQQSELQFAREQERAILLYWMRTIHNHTFFVVWLVQGQFLTIEVLIRSASHTELVVLVHYEFAYMHTVLYAYSTALLPYTTQILRNADVITGKSVSNGSNLQNTHTAYTLSLHCSPLTIKQQRQQLGQVQK